MRSEKSGSEIKKIKIGKRAVTLVFDEEEIKISPDTYTDFRLYVGKILSGEEIAALKNSDDISKLLKSALISVSKGHPSKQEMIEKLKLKKATPKAIAKVIATLEESGLLDDCQLIKDYLSYAELKGFGKKRIISALIEKGLPGHLIEGITFDEARERASAARARGSRASSASARRPSGHTRP